MRGERGAGGMLFQYHDHALMGRSFCCVPTAVHIRSTIGVLVVVSSECTRVSKMGYHRLVGAEPLFTRRTCYVRPLCAKSTFSNPHNLQNSSCYKVMRTSNVLRFRTGAGREGVTVMGGKGLHSAKRRPLFLPLPASLPSGSTR